MFKALAKIKAVDSLVELLYFYLMHEIAIVDNKPAFAYVGKPAWHGLGNEIPVNASEEQQAQAAGLNWDALRIPNKVCRPDGSLFLANSVSLVRSDTLDWLEPVILGEVSPGWKPVQPRDLLRTLQQICENLGATFETAGALRDGRKVFALAKMPGSLDLGPDDETLQYVIIYTGFDKVTSTVVKQTSIRVVCANTLALCFRDRKANRSSQIKFFHSSDPDKKLNDETIQALTSDWRGFESMALQAAATDFRGNDLRDFMHVMASRFITDADLDLSQASLDFDAVARLNTKAPLYGKRKVLPDADKKEVKAVRTATAIAELRERLLFNAHSAPGQKTEAAHNSLWGAINAVTYTFGNGQDVQRKTAQHSNNMLERRLGMSNNKHEKILAELVESILTRPARGCTLDEVGVGLDLDDDHVRAQVYEKI